MYKNEITAFIDASNIYGSDEETLEQLRDAGGKFKIQDGLLLPDGEGGVLTGDVRAAENIALTSMHTLFVREHNWWVDKLAVQGPWLSSDALFDGARARVEAEMQAVTFNEFLPALVGERAVPSYTGYDQNVDPGISAEFSVAAYRLGHTLLSPEIERHNEDGTEIDGGDLALRYAFFNNAEIQENGGIAPILRGVSEGAAQAYDTMLVEDVRSFLFGPPGAGGFDLASLNIQHGRDIGIPTYNDMREAIGLSPAEDFAGITSDQDTAVRLEAAYGDVNLVDLWVGGLAEDRINGGLLGETFSAIVVDQFSRIRDGDRFWRQADRFAPQEEAALWSTTLSDIVLRNTEIEYLQRDVFTAYHRIGGSEGRDRIAGTGDGDLLIGFGGNDRLAGRAGDDELFGGDGNDILVGGAGSDILTGGSGSDRFVFSAVTTNHEIVADFSVGDSLRLHQLDLEDAFVSLAEARSLFDMDVTFAFSETQSITFEGIGPAGLGVLFSGG